MYTSIAVFALSSLVGALTQEKEPVWQNDYWEAHALGKSAKKPLAVFIGSGSKGYQKVAQDGKLTKKMREILTEKYICVYVDTSGESGQMWARVFRFDTGIVLSDRTGDLQAFRHEGSLAAKELTKYLERFADPSVVVQSTTTHGVQRTSYYPSENAIIQRDFGGSTRSC